MYIVMLHLKSCLVSRRYFCFNRLLYITRNTVYSQCRRVGKIEGIIANVEKLYINNNDIGKE